MSAIASSAAPGASWRARAAAAAASIGPSRTLSLRGSSPVASSARPKQTTSTGSRSRLSRRSARKAREASSAHWTSSNSTTTGRRAA
jgi:hypothetical protein